MHWVFFVTGGRRQSCVRIKLSTGERNDTDGEPMKKKAILVGLCILMLGLFCGGLHVARRTTIGSRHAVASDLVLAAEATEWSGWGGGGSDQLGSRSYDVELGKRYRLPNGWLGGPAFTITDVGEESVTIETDGEMAPQNANGAINLLDTQSEFVVTTDSPCQFATPSMDAGTSYTLTLSHK